jgi:hypothetical protein
MMLAPCKHKDYGAMHDAQRLNLPFTAIASLFGPHVHFLLEQQPVTVEP